MSSMYAFRLIVDESYLGSFDLPVPRCSHIMHRYFLPSSSATLLNDSFSGWLFSHSATHAAAAENARSPAFAHSIAFGPSRPNTTADFGTTDVGPLVLGMKNAGVDATYLPLVLSSNLAIVQTAAQNDLKFKLAVLATGFIVVRLFKRWLSNSYLPHTKLEPEMRRTHAAAGFEIEQLSEIPMLDTGAESEIVALAQELSGNHDIAKVSFGTEGSQFQRAGIPTVVCGPGSVAQAHKPNEYVTLDQIAKCDAFLRRLMQRICA